MKTRLRESHFKCVPKEEMTMSEFRMFKSPGTENPAGAPKVTEKLPIAPDPASSVSTERDSAHTEADPGRDLERAAQQKTS